MRLLPYTHQSVTVMQHFHAVATVSVTNDVVVSAGALQQQFHVLVKMHTYLRPAQIILFQVACNLSATQEVVFQVGGKTQHGTFSSTIHRKTRVSITFFLVFLLKLL